MTKVKVLCTIAVFVYFLYNHSDDPGAVHIVWSDGSSSELKNKFMVKFLQSLSQKHKILSYGSTFLQALGKEFLMELVAKLRL